MRTEKQANRIFLAAGIMVSLICLASFMAGKYPLTWSDLLAGDADTVRVFMTLRLSRTLMGMIGGLGLGIAGMVYQTVFRNPLASPDIIGVSSGASAGAAFAILFLANTPGYVTGCAFLGSIMAILLSLGIASLARDKGNLSIVLSGLAIHALAQTVLMMLKTTADPDRELASIEYWIMGSLNGITLKRLPVSCTIVVLGVVVLILLYRQVLLLSVEDAEAKLLGVSVEKMRMLVVLTATLIVAAIVSVAGIITFVGLLAPHIGRILMGDSRLRTLMLSGMIGGGLLCLADIFARTAAASELPVSVFTSLIGAPFLLYLLLKRTSSYV